jgi:hypothetical protein
MYIADGMGCHVVFNFSVCGLSSGEKIAEGVNVWAEPAAGPNLCKRRLGTSFLLDSRPRDEFLSRAIGFCLLAAIGSDSPLNFPRLATPTPHVKVVLYPAQSFPLSRHGVQYGLFLSQLTF